MYIGSPSEMRATNDLTHGGTMSTKPMRGAEPQFAVSPKPTESNGSAATFSRLRHRGGSTYLKDLRSVAGLSQQEMAVLLGVGQRHIINVEQRGTLLKPSARQHLIGLGRYWQDHRDLPDDAWGALFKAESNDPDLYRTADAEKHRIIEEDSEADADPYGWAWRRRKRLGRVASALIGFIVGAGAVCAGMIL